MDKILFVKTGAKMISKIHRNMNIFLSIMTALVWGQLSTYFFFRGWISFLGIIYCLFGIVRRRNHVISILPIAFSKISEVLFFGLILFSGFYIFYHRLGLGRTTAEALVYLVSAGVRMFFVIPKISAAIDDFIKEVDGANIHNK